MEEHFQGQRFRKGCLNRDVGELDLRGRNASSSERCAPVNRRRDEEQRTLTLSPEAGRIVSQPLSASSPSSYPTFATSNSTLSTMSNSPLATLYPRASTAS